MSACEECWTAAYLPSRMTGRPQVEVYRELLVKNEAAHAKPMTPEITHSDHFHIAQPQAPVTSAPHRTTNEG